MVETCQRFNEHVAALITELVATRCEKIQRLLEIEIKVSEINNTALAKAIMTVLNDTKFTSVTDSRFMIRSSAIHYELIQNYLSGGLNKIS